MTEVVWQALIAGIVTVVLAYMQHRAALRVEQVRKDLKEENKAANEKLDELAATADSTNSLVDGAMSVQLEVNSVLARRVAAETGDPGDAAVADKAEKALREHNLKQHAVESAEDEQKETTEEPKQ